MRYSNGTKTKIIKIPCGKKNKKITDSWEISEVKNGRGRKPY